MPWQRRPSWEYLPHLNERQEPMRERDEHEAGQREQRRPAPSAARGADNAEVACRREEDDLPRGDQPIGEEDLAHVRRRDSTNAERATGAAAPEAQGPGDGAMGQIRGRGLSPGATSSGLMAADTQADSGPRIRGHGSVPGSGGDARAARAQQTLNARNAHLARSLADHAERVAKRNACGDRPAGPSAMDRMNALRRRIAARRDDRSGLQSGELAGDALLGVARQDGDGAGNQCRSSGEVQGGGSSIEEGKIHLGAAVEGEACAGASAASATAGSAMAAAAAADAWHGCELRRVDADGRQLNAR